MSVSPAISVVIPTYKRADLLKRCVTALLAQTLDPASYEVVIADDAAESRTRKSVEAWAALPGAPVFRYVPVAGSHGPAAARNQGWHAATGTVIAFTDDDCIPERDWLEAIQEAF